jgi:hypothetical protein
MTMNWILYTAVVDATGKEVNIKSVVDGSTLVPPKGLRLKATGIGQVTRFQIYKYHESAVRQVLRFIKVPVPDRSPTNISLDAVADEAAGYQSSELWMLPAKKGPFTNAYLFLADGGNDESGLVYSAKKSRAKVKKKVKGSVGAGLPHIPGVPLPHGKAGASWERAVTVEIVYAVDPDMSVSVLTGSALAEHVLNVVEDAIEDDDDLRGQFDAEVADLRQALPFAYQGPEDWSLEPPHAVHGDEGETAEMDVDFSAASEGMGYFAFLFSDPQSPDDDELSSIFGLEVTSEEKGLALSVITNFDEMELRLPVW